MGTSEVNEIQAQPELKLVDPIYNIVSYHGWNLPKEYEALVYSRWLNSLRYGCTWFKNIKSDAFYQNYHPYIGRLMQKPDSIVKLALLPKTDSEPEVVLGFSVSREDVLDYMHVHKDHRKMGIAKALMPAKVTAFTHLTMTALQIWRHNQKYRHLEYNPFA